MADKATILKNAQRFVAKGQIDKAIAEWKKLISESPNDGNIYNTIGDLYLKQKKTDRAIETYLKGAEAFREAGFALKTIAVYKKLIKLAPGRIEIQVKLGDLNIERGLTNNGIQDYLSAAKAYSQSGKIKESLDIYRKIADLDPAKTNNRIKLADMCLKEGFKQEAVVELTKLTRYYRDNGKPKEAGEVQDKINKIDPSGELYGVAQKLVGEEAGGEASKEEEKRPLDEAKELIGVNDFGKAKDLLTPFVQDKPDDPVGHELLGEALLKSGEPEPAFESFKKAVYLRLNRKEFGQAGKLMKDFLEDQPHQVDAMMLQAEIFENSDNLQLAVSSYAHAIDEYLINGDTQAARSLYAKIKGLDSGHRDVRRLRHSCEGTETAAIQAPPEDKLEGTLDQTYDAPESAAAADGKEAQGEQTIEEEAPAPPPLADPSVLEEYFTEADVFLKYGLPDKAVDQMRKVLALDPKNPSAHEKLKEIYVLQDQTDKAIDECLELMAIYKELGDSQRRTEIVAEAEQLDPENPRIREATDLAPILDSGRMDAILQEEAPAEEEAGAEEHVLAEEDHPEKTLDATIPEEGEPMAAAPVDLPPESAPPAPEENPEDVAEQIAEADFYFQQGLNEEALKIYEAVLGKDPDNESAKEKLNALQEQMAAAAAEASQESPEDSRETSEVEALSVPGGDAAPDKSDEEIQLEADLDQSFSAYMEDGAQKDAPVSGKSEMEAHVEADLDQSFASYMAGDAQAAAPSQDKAAAPDSDTPSSGTPNQEDLVDLSSILDSEEVGADLEHLFDDYEKETAEEAEEEVDYETHYNLGIAYKEMGLLNEAIAEFEKALAGPDRFIDSSHMLSACYQESNRSGEAVELLGKALADPRCDKTQRLWLTYDLASLKEKENRLDEALEGFQKIRDTDPRFKDVEKKIQGIEKLLGRGGKSPAPAAGDEPEEEDLEMMMDRVFGETSSPDNETSGSRKVAAVDTGKQDGSKKKDKISYL